MPPDPKPSSRIKDPELLRQLHREWQECVLCLGTAFSEGRLSLHHVHKHPRNDVRANLVMLCGDGVSGCHGDVERHDPVTCALLGTYLQSERPDTLAYLNDLLGENGARAWLERQFGIPSDSQR